MLKKYREQINIFIAKSPRKAVLLGIILFNAIFISFAAASISVMSQYYDGLRSCNFWEAFYYTVAMIFDAGCIDNIIQDVRQAGAFAAIVCMSVVLIGMIFFTGAVIGYVTNVISDFIESKNNGKNKLSLSDHIVIINWNSRAAEILNKYLYTRESIKIIIFVPDHRDEIDEEIRNHLDTLLMKEAAELYQSAEKMSYFEKKKYLRKNMPKEKLTYIVREGDIAAATDLDDICISKAKTVIILDEESTVYNEKGNTQTIKTLIQVSEISKGNQNQTIIVEVNDDWTEDLVQKIILLNNEEGNEQIFPVTYNKLLGNINAQIAITPELYDFYELLFSSKGPDFSIMDIPEAYSKEKENACIAHYLSHHYSSIPLGVIQTIKGKKLFYIAGIADDLIDEEKNLPISSKAKLNTNPVIKKRNIIVLGHNSNMIALMDGFESFRQNCADNLMDDTLCVIMIDDEDSLKKHNFYKDYPWVETLAADIYDDQAILEKMQELSMTAGEKTTILILSDDQVENEEKDAYVFPYLINIQEKLHQRQLIEPDFKRENYTLITEIINPKNEAIVKKYGSDKVILTSKFAGLIAQRSIIEAASYLYSDTPSPQQIGEHNIGKRVFLINAEDFFDEIPNPCTAGELIRMVFSGSPADNTIMLLGYIRHHQDIVFFNQDQRSHGVTLDPKDQLLLFKK